MVKLHVFRNEYDNHVPESHGAHCHASAPGDLYFHLLFWGDPYWAIYYKIPNSVDGTSPGTNPLCPTLNCGRKRARQGVSSSGWLLISSQLLLSEPHQQFFVQGQAPGIPR